VTTIEDLGYPVVVAADVAAPLADLVQARAQGRAIVVCDAAVQERARTLARRIRARAVLPFALGERRKTMRTLESVLSALAAAGADRGTLLVSVGGGVAGDLFGFAAAVYMRGIRFVNVATSLTAMVDAAIGGKTGVDLPAGKNLAGVFRDPLAVFCDVGSLHTLPERHLRDGLGEVVKHAVIEGGDAFEALETLAPHALRKWPWETVIADSVKVKTMIVADDRVEQGARETLNLGHTFGHAVERAGGYRTAHGSAVAIGLRGAGLLALRTGRFSAPEHVRVLALLTLLGLPIAVRDLTPDALLDAMKVDKKARDGRLRFVLPRALGDVEYGVEAPSRAVRTVLDMLATPPTDRETRVPR
jgi:3-dehydroquinate synthase